MFLKWEKGRQAGSYSKFALLPTWISKFINADAYILSLPPNCSIIDHRDEVGDGWKHYRLNITLKKSGESRMTINGPIWRWWRVEVFRPDLYTHGLDPIASQMYMLTFGCRV